jgi:hypothetical protein
MESFQNFTFYAKFTLTLLFMVGFYDHGIVFTAYNAILT